MAEHARNIDALHLTLSALFVVSAGLVSLSLRLGLERSLLVASLRTVGQLLLIGYVLRWVFELRHRGLVLALLVLMVAAAARAAVSRSARSYSGVYLASFVALSVTALTTSIATTHIVIGVTPWWSPQYLIPLLGMVLGNALTGMTLCLDELLRALSERRELVEAELAMGATRWEAARTPLAEAVRRGMIPTINSMMVVGIVSLPGMMTGQILQGADPLVAVRYQIVIMFVLAAASSFGCMLLALVTFRRLFNDHHQLRAERIVDSHRR